MPGDSILRPLLVLIVLLVFGLHTGGCWATDWSRPWTGYHVALHAQVLPSDDKVVGSVITTNGLRNALRQRSDIHNVEIFYPGNYSTLFDTQWDFVVIEGWFLGLTEFIQVVRNKLPNVIVVFYCLDPTFPSLTEILEFDVDGIMTNSRDVERQCALRSIPSTFVMLAADPEVMRPNESVSRTHAAVYVGAGGRMLESKPKLYAMLLDAAGVGLRLQGLGWHTVPHLQNISRGPLPMLDLPSAYSSAEVVLASTIQSQDRAGMINNRIFEALACGNIVMSDVASPTLQSIFGDSQLIDFYSSSDESSVLVSPSTGDPSPSDAKGTATSALRSLLEWIHSHPEEAQARRRRARELVIRHHSWAHRVVQMMSFLVHLQSMSLSDRVPLRTRRNRPVLLWTESDHLNTHPDYLTIIKPYLFHQLSTRFQVMVYSESQWLTALQVAQCSSAESLLSSPSAATTCKTWLSQFDMLFAAMTPFDALDLSFQSLPSMIRLPNHNAVQRRIGYMLGVDGSRIASHCLKSSDENVCSTLEYKHFDVLFYRSRFEHRLLFQLLRAVHSRSIEPLTVSPADESVERLISSEEVLRSQHLFGIPWLRDNLTDVFMQASPLSQSPSSSSSSSSDSSSDDGWIADLTIVCSFAHRELCTADERSRYSAAVDSVDSQAPPRTMLVLLGGQTLDDWLNVDGFLPKESIPLSTTTSPSASARLLSSIIHIQAQSHAFSSSTTTTTSTNANMISHRYDSLARLVARTRALVLLTIHEERIDDSQSIESISTSADVLWPFVLGAVLGKRLQLNAVNNHVISISQPQRADSSNAVEDSCVDWDNLSPHYLVDRRFQFGLDRALGMPPRQSQLSMHLLEIDSVSQHCRTCHETVDATLIASGYVRSLMNRYHSTAVPAFALLRVDYHDLEIGKDGQLCVNHIHGSADDMMCLLRTMRYISLLAPRDIVLSSSLTAPESFPIRFSLRGSVFGELVMNYTVTVPLSLPALPLSSLSMPESADSSQRFVGLIMDEIFEYTLSQL